MSLSPHNQASKSNWIGSAKSIELDYWASNARKKRIPSQNQCIQSLCPELNWWKETRIQCPSSNHLLNNKSCAIISSLNRVSDWMSSIKKGITFVNLSQLTITHHSEILNENFFKKVFSGEKEIKTHTYAHPNSYFSVINIQLKLMKV